MNYVPYPLRHFVGTLIEKSPAANVPLFYKAGGCLRASNVNHIREMIQYRRIYQAQHIVPGGKIPEMPTVEAHLTDIYGAMQLADMQYYYPDDILYKVDRASMAVSLKAGYPCLTGTFWNLHGRFPQSISILKESAKRF